MATVENQPERALKRRGFLRFLLPGMVGFVAGVSVQQVRKEEERLGVLAKDETPSAIFFGGIDVRKGVNVRLAPEIPRTLDGRIIDNKISWNDIIAVNGRVVSLKPVPEESFLQIETNGLYIMNPWIVEGQSPEPEVSDTSPWIKLEALVRRWGGLQINRLPVYVNVSYETREFVSPWSLFYEGDYVPVRFEQLLDRRIDVFAEYDLNRKINIENVGMVFPQKPNPQDSPSEKIV